jgi:peptidoglycan DL-endopeptidase CwlO
VASAHTYRRYAGLVTTALIAIVSLLLGVAAPASAKPKPTITSVMAKLSKLSHQAEQLTEQFNKANQDVADKQKQAALAVSAANAARQRFQAASGELRSSLVEQYKGAPISATGALFSSGSSQQYIDKLALMSLLTYHRANVAASMNVAHNRAEAAQQAAAKALSAARAVRQAFAKRRAEVEKEQAKFKAVLNTLTAAQKRTYFTGGQKPVTHWSPVPAPSAKATIAVNFALAQLGKPYVWGAAGPSSYDCSGLVMAAWGAAGVQLTHYAPTQFTAGHHVPESDLAPGDLVFFYPGIQHVAMYIGKGMVVHAPQSGDVVKIVPLSTMQADYQGAVRLP